MLVSRYGLVAATVVGLATMSDCMDPTEIVVDIATNVACSVITANGVAISVGSPGQDDAGINTVTSLCGGDGGVGSIVITPSGGPDESVGIRIVLGVDASAETCATTGEGACIVARRALHFTPHTPLTLPIELDEACIGVPCDPYSTCVSGSCVDASVPPCSGGVCTLPDAAPPPCANQTVVLDPTGTTPHIARTSAGYVVMWLTANYEIAVEELDASGNVLHGPFTMIASLGDAGQIAGSLDALGSDGTTYFLTWDTTYPVVPTFDTQLVASDGGAASVAMTVSEPVSGPASGILWDSADSTYLTMVIQNGSVALWGFNPMQQTLLTFPPKGTLSGPSLAFWNAVYYASFNANASCYVYDVTRTGPAAFTLGTTSTYGNCVAVRTAASASDLAIVVADSTGNLAWSSNTSGSGSGGPSLPSAFVAVGTAPHFHVLWREVTQLVTASTDGSPPTVVAGTTGYTGGRAGFDAVADDGSHEGYAVAYWGHGTQGTALYFTHYCQ